MTLKPRFSNPHPHRLPGEKRMTIAAGFVANDGIVICADMQETYGELLKINTPKILVRPEAHTPMAPRIVFAGAGHGPFIDKLANEAWKKVAAVKVSDFSEVCDLVEAAIKEMHEEFGRICQPGAMPTAELIYAVVYKARCGLFRATGPIVNPVEHYGSVGVGLYLADYIYDRLGLGTGGLVDSGWLRILATYLLQQAKDYISGCGGESHILTLHLDGRISRMDRADEMLIANHVRQLDRNSSTVLMSSPDLELDDAVLERRIEMFLALARNLRDEQKKDRAQIEVLRRQNPLYDILNQNKDRTIKQ